MIQLCRCCFIFGHGHDYGGAATKLVAPRKRGEDRPGIMATTVLGELQTSSTLLVERVPAVSISPHVAPVTGNQCIVQYLRNTVARSDVS